MEVTELTSLKVDINGLCINSSGLCIYVLNIKDKHEILICAMITTFFLIVIKNCDIPFTISRLNYS